MTEETGRAKSTWLPNLVGKVSIWKLAPDLNESKFFDGRLLVPETEGSDTLPSKVWWKVRGMVPLREARAKYPDETAAAIKDFVACLERVSKELANPKSGYFKYKEAFTVPAFETKGDEAEHYYYDPQSRKLHVIDWGASPRDIGGQSGLVFGYEDFGALFADEPEPPKPAAAPVAAAAAAGVVAGAAVAAAVDPKKDEKKEEEKKKEEKKAFLILGRPWWHWLIVLLIVIAIILLIAWLLRACDKAKPFGPDAGDADAAEVSDVIDGDVGDVSDSSVGDAIDDGDAVADGDATLDGDAGDVKPDGDAKADGDAGDAKSDAKDAKSDGKGDDDGSGGGGSGGGGSGGGGSGGGGSGGGGPGGGGSGGGGPGGGGGGGGDKPGGGGGGAATLPHRSHFHPQAVKWRVTAGKELLAPGSPPDGNGASFEVHLKEGSSFEKVRVQWQDAAGVWHD